MQGKSQGRDGVSTKWNIMQLSKMNIKEYIYTYIYIDLETCPSKVLEEIKNGGVRDCVSMTP